jgi:hypothetical protein
MIWQRIKNLWRLSSVDKPVFFDENRIFKTFEDKEKEIEEKPKKMAVIIKRKTTEKIIKEVLNNEN